VARRASAVALVALTACGRVHFDTQTASDSAAPAVDAAAPSLVQKNSAAMAAATMLSITLPARPTAGDVLVMIGGYPADLIVATTGGGATWTRAVASTANSNVELWYGVSDGTNATVTITGTMTDDFWMQVSEWRGLVATNTVDQAVAAPGVVSPAAPGTFMTSATSDLVLLAVSDVLPNTFGMPIGAAWQDLGNVSDPSYVQSSWWTIAAPLTLLSPQVTETYHHWDALLVAFHMTN